MFLKFQDGTMILLNWDSNFIPKLYSLPNDISRTAMNNYFLKTVVVIEEDIENLSI